MYTYVYIYIGMHTCRHTDIVHTCRRNMTHIYVHTHICTYTYMYIHIYVNVYTYICGHTYICRYIHMHIHTYALHARFIHQLSNSCEVEYEYGSNTHGVSHLLGRLLRLGTHVDPWQCFSLMG